ncbi:MAG: carboxylate-amine ligase [Thermoanaerobaculia bacterium]|nr:carboxylate-amine ligase [Thermoanaerobaculia bacterium]
MATPRFTIGLEEEYQIIDPETRALTSYIQEFLEQGRLVLQDQIKPELMRSQVEVGSHICHDMAEARAELVRLRRTVCQVAEANDLVIAAASTHPFSSWTQQQITDGARYSRYEEAMADIARRMLIFGMHVHIGIDDKELMIDVMDQARYFIPHLVALSTSSPFWNGRRTGLKSYRSIVFQDLPRTGPPPDFSSWAEYQSFVDVLLRTGSIDEPTKIWWDIRPHPKFPTLEFRMTDICTKVDEAIAVASLILALVTKLVQLRERNQSWRRYRHHLVTENKWRAVRYGIDGCLIDFGKQEEVPTRDLTRELLELIDDVVDPLGIRKEIEYIHTILEEGTSADRQLAVFEKTGDLKSVVDLVVQETRAGWE